MGGIFTKVLLAVIAGCLVLLTVQSLRPQAVVAEGAEVLKINLVRIGGESLPITNLRAILDKLARE